MSDETMQVVRVADGALAVDEVDVPSPGPGELRVRVTLAGVNYWDLMQRMGQVPAGAHGVPGVEGVGVVDAVGPDCAADLVGRRVAWSKVNGSYAQYACGPADLFIEVPADLPDEQAAGLLMQGVTAQYLAADTVPLVAGDVALVFAAAGGVGTLLTQLLRSGGVEVIGVVGSAGKAEVAQAAGATAVLVDGAELARDVLRRAPDGVRVVFDGNGGPAMLRDFDLLRPRGWVVAYGTSAGPIPAVEAGLLAAGSRVYTRVAGKHFAGDAESWRPRAQHVLARAVAAELTVAPVTVSPLADAAAAQRSMESRASTGKLLLEIS